MLLADLEIKRDNSFPVSRQIADYLQENIKSNRLKPGQKLPNASELAKGAGVGNHTLKDAIAILKEMGLVRTIPGKGTFVAPHQASTTAKQPQTATKNIAVFSTFKQDKSAIKTSHPQTVNSILSSLWEFGSRGYLVSPYINLEDYDAVADELKSGGFDGAIWLYPQDSHWQVIQRLFNDGLPIVTATHYGNNYEIPSVQGNGAVTGAVICDYMLGEGVEKILLFWGGGSKSDSAENVITITGHVGSVGLSVLLYTRGLIDFVEVENVAYSDPENMYALLKEKVQYSSVKTGVIIPNNELFYSYFIENTNDFKNIFANCCLVLGTSEKQNNLLEPLTKLAHFKTLLSPLQSIGKSSVHKLMNILDGKFENNATMVPDIFGDFKLV